MAVNKLPIRGKALQKTVIDWAHTRGWHAAHFPAVETVKGWRTAVAADAKGFPDIILVRERLIAVEIKGDGDSLKPDQIEWRDRFQRAGIEFYVVTPKDWPDNVMEILK